MSDVSELSGNASGYPHVSPDNSSPLPLTGWFGTILDAPDPVALARFYSALLGWPIVNESPTFATLAAPQDGIYLGVHISADYVPPVWPPQPGQQQMMLHLDVGVSDVDVAVDAAVELGARLAEHQPQDNVRVLLDPVGHPFCLYLDADDAA